ncbi:hypothetical protein Halru_0922 [Halovivax ruber XH-70]|uniref:Uncharacterized protein n=2 Tax=Halovivax ruber TaxID=387341 RepID=L0I9N8_HALRX|nr:hypothetical protein Halru_0922 [Halovivax ruber XH-70]
MVADPCPSNAVPSKTRPSNGISEDTRSRMTDGNELLTTERGTALRSWAVVVGLIAATIATLVQGAYLWAGLSGTIVALAVLPAVARGTPLVVAPWVVLLVAAVPIWVRLVGAFPAAGFLTVAAIALLVTVELDAYTPVEMTPRFAAAFVVIATMAVAAVWVIGQWLSDTLVGTTFLTSTGEVMWDLILATAFGGLGGVFFVTYVVRRDDVALDGSGESA